MPATLVEFLIFVASTGVLFNEQFRRNKLAVLLAGLVALASSYFLGETLVERLGPKAPSQGAASASPPALEPTAQAPQSRQSSSTEAIFPPQTAIDMRPLPDTQTARFLLANWVSWSAKNVHATAWIGSGNSLKQIAAAEYAYLGSADQVSFVLPLTPGPNQLVAICLSYSVNSHRVEAVHFFSSFRENTYRRLRDTVFEVDGPGKLCSSMPASAQTALR